MSFVKSGGWYVGCNPNTHEVYADETHGAGAWETVTVTPHEQGVAISFNDDTGQLAVNEHSRKLERRRKGDLGGWGGWWRMSEDGKVAVISDERATVRLDVEGYTPDPPVQPIYPLHVSNRDFIDSTGARYTVIGSTELLLAWRYDLEGEAAILPTLQERQSLGFNNLRCLLQKDINNAGRPWKMPLEKLKPFFDLAATHGFRIQGTILADCQVVNPSVADQQRRVGDVRAALAGVTNNMEQLGNEADKNGFDPRNFSRPTDRIAANASTTQSGAGKDYPYWDFFCFSGRRDPLNAWIRENGPVEFMYSTSAEGKPWGGVPAICDESAKPGVSNNYQPRDWERAGAQAKSGCGGRIHTLTGTGDKNQPHIVPSGLFTPFERECAAAFVKGVTR